MYGHLRTLRGNFTVNLDKMYIFGTFSLEPRVYSCSLYKQTLLLSSVCSLTVQNTYYTALLQIKAHSVRCMQFLFIRGKHNQCQHNNQCSKTDRWVFHVCSINIAVATPIISGANIIKGNSDNQKEHFTQNILEACIESVF